MSKGGKGSSQSETRQNISSTATNQQVGASEGALAFGTGSHDISITSNDASVVKGASDAIQNAADTAIHAGVAQTHDALTFADSIGNNSINQNSNIALATVQSAERANSEANGILSKSFETYAGSLKDNAGDAPQNTFQNALKYIVVGAVVLGGIWFFTKNK